MVAERMRASETGSLGDFIHRPVCLHKHRFRGFNSLVGKPFARPLACCLDKAAFEGPLAHIRFAGHVADGPVMANVFPDVLEEGSDARGWP